MEQWLELYPDTMDWSCGNNDDMALGAMNALDHAEKEINMQMTELRKPGPCRAERCWELLIRINRAMQMLSLRLPPQPEWVNQFQAKIALEAKENITGAADNVIKRK
ncbi:MAG: hypothetical protein V8S58_14375 [Lachnospiraceae bacterium]